MAGILVVEHFRMEAVTSRLEVRVTAYRAGGQISISGIEIHIFEIYVLPMASSVRSIASAFAILRLLADSGPLTLTGIGQELGLSPSSCLNLLRTLVDQGAVEREGRAKLYRLARSWAESKLFDAGRDRAMIDAMRAAMAQVANKFEATVGLWKVSPGARLQLIAHAECNAAMRIRLADGQRQPIGGGAVGRALAAAEKLSDAELARRFAEIRWQKPLPLGTYLAQVALAAQHGFTIDDGMTFTGVTSLAAPVGEEHPAYLVSASVFAGSRSKTQLHAIGAALAWMGRNQLKLAVGSGGGIASGAIKY